MILGHGAVIPESTAFLKAGAGPEPPRNNQNAASETRLAVDGSRKATASGELKSINHKKTRQGRIFVFN
jgi:hypothetical protein